MKYVERRRPGGALRLQICIFILVSFRICLLTSPSRLNIFLSSLSLLIKTAAVKEKFRFKLYIWLSKTRETVESHWPWYTEMWTKSTRGLLATRAPCTKEFSFMRKCVRPGSNVEFHMCRTYHARVKCTSATFESFKFDCLH